MSLDTAIAVVRARRALTAARDARSALVIQIQGAEARMDRAASALKAAEAAHASAAEAEVTQAWETVLAEEEAKTASETPVQIPPAPKKPQEEKFRFGEEQAGG